MYLKLCFVTFLTLFYEKHVEEEVASGARDGVPQIILIAQRRISDT